MAKITREQFLNNAIRAFKPVFKKHGFPLPANIRVSVGWPSGTRPTSRSRAIGQAWHNSSSADGSFEIFISPEIGERERALDILAHELVHVAAGFEEGHKGKFKELALRIGLKGPMTATTAGDGFTELMARASFKALGKYPHAALGAMGAGVGGAPKKKGDDADGDDGVTTTGKKKQGSRMVKLECTECACIIRTAQKWIDDGQKISHGCGGHFETV